MLENITFVNISTTGPDPVKDEIFEFAALKFCAGEEQDRFDSLAKIDKPLPRHLQNNGGIAQKDLDRAPRPQTALKRLLDFIGNDTVGCWDAGHVGNFLDAQSRRHFRAPVIDVERLAWILLPDADSYDLDQLAAHFGIQAQRTGRAMPDLELTVELWRELLRHGERLSLPVVSEIARILRTVGDPLVEVFDQLERKVIAKSLGARKKILDDCVKNFSSIIHAKPRPRADDERQDVDEDAVCAVFDDGGQLAKTHSSYERRQEQIDMARAVCRAFNTSTHLMVEAGTGTGKSMAYLVPAILWSKRNGDQIIISTNTKNLQAQLFFKDLPYLHDHLGVAFKSALIKGRGNYLCVRKFLYLVHECERELSPDERLSLLPLISWFDVTKVGDVSECAGFMAEPWSTVRERVTSSAEECPGRKCPHFDHCFLRRARGLSQQADVVVANHSVVFAELGSDTPVLPPYEHIVLDEAHNIEQVATEFLARRVSRMRIFRILNRLFRPTREGSGTGLLPAILAKVRTAAQLDEEVAKLIDDACVDAFGAVTETSDEATNFFALFAELFDADAGAEKVRFQIGRRPKEKWEPIAHGKRAFIATTAKLAKKLDEIRAALTDAPPGALESQEQFATDLKGAVDALREMFQDLEFILRAKEKDWAYWVERRQWREEQYEVCAAPLEIGSMMVELLYSPKRTVIMSSATLTVDGEFDFMKQRLGATSLGSDEMRTVAVGSPFDFDLQALVAVPNFLPDPGAPGGEFEDALTRLLVELFGATEGRGLVLFTSYAMLNHVYPELKEALGRRGILVLGQGHDGDRTHLATVFRENTSSVLLGTQSFWEGVDFVGESLSCLVVVKLPFQVFTDPLVQARCEYLTSQGFDPFTRYSVPSAAIKFRQGFGRLIRTRTDRGVVVATDKRVVTKRYGQPFLRSLPTRHKLYPDKESLLRDVTNFFT